MAGAAYSVLAPDSFTFTPALGNVLTDSVDTNDKPYLATFPYVATPHQGQEHAHTNLYRMSLPVVTRGRSRSSSNSMGIKRSLRRKAQAATGAQPSPPPIGLTQAQPIGGTLNRRKLCICSPGNAPR